MMGFKEMMEYIEEVGKRRKTPPAKGGTYVSLSVAKECGQKLHDWCVEHKINNIIPIEDMHVTIVYSKKHLPNIKDHEFNLPITAKITNLEVFKAKDGSNVLVAKLDPTDLEIHHMKIRTEQGATHDFPDYLPHVSLSYGYSSKSVPRGQIPAIDVVFDKVNYEDLDDG